jgi:AcrR family transcriptional regulator
VSTLRKKSTHKAPSYHHGNLREALVAMGMELLEEGQSADFSQRELTRRVGVSANAAYRHFASKEELLTAMAAEGFRQLASAQITAIQGQPNDTERFLAGGRAYVAFARLNPSLFRLMFGRFAAANRNEELSAAAQISYEGMCHGVAAVLAKPVGDKQVTVAATHAWSLVHGLSQLIIDGQFEAHTDDIDGLVDAVFQQVPLGKKLNNPQ